MVLKQMEVLFYRLEGRLMLTYMSTVEVALGVAKGQGEDGVRFTASWRCSGR